MIYLHPSNGLRWPFSLWEQGCSTRTDYEFQTRTGSAGHLAGMFLVRQRFVIGVSNPNGLRWPFSPPPFSRVRNDGEEFQTRTGSAGHLACCACSVAPEAKKGRRFRGTRFLRYF